MADGHFTRWGPTHYANLILSHRGATERITISVCVVVRVFYGYVFG